MEFSNVTMQEAIEEAHRQAAILGELNPHHALLFYARGPTEGVATPSPPVGFDPAPMSPLVGYESPPSAEEMWLIRFKNRFWDREASWASRPETEVVTVVMHNYARELEQAAEAEADSLGS